MAYNEKLAERIRGAIKSGRGFTEKKMFGGIAFLHRGNMFSGVIGDDLMVRVGPAGHDAALKERHARPMDFTGRKPRGYIYVAPAGCATERALESWLERGLSFVRTLPAK